LITFQFIWTITRTSVYSWFCPIVGLWHIYIVCNSLCLNISSIYIVLKQYNPLLKCVPKREAPTNNCHCICKLIAITLFSFLQYEYERKINIFKMFRSKQGIEFNWWKAKPSGSIACTGQKQPRFYWSCLSVPHHWRLLARTRALDN